jgi:predicted phage terminase large subunit-like protein
MFKKHWWRYWKPRNTHLPPVRVKGPGGVDEYIEAVELPMDWDNSAQSWDMTFKDTSDGSYVVGMVGKRRGSQLFLIDLIRARMDFPATLHALATLTAKHPDVVAKLIEEKANGAAVISSVESTMSGVIAVQVDGSKEARAHSVTPFVEAHNVFLPHPDLPGYEWVGGFIAELAAFPTGKNDDQVDGFAQLGRYLLAGNGGWIREPSAAWESYWANQ